MSADNWRELLDDPEVERLVQKVTAIEGRKAYRFESERLLLDDLESYMWDRSVDIAECAPANLAPGTDAWLAYLWVSLRNSINDHRREQCGRRGQTKRDLYERTRSLEGITDRAPDYVAFRHLNYEDPLAHLLRLERLTAAVSKAEARSDAAHRSTSDGTCAEPMCTKPPKAHGLCALHYDRTRQLWQGANTATCSVEDCDRPATQGHGLCRRHYQAARRNDPNRPRCSAEDCDRPSFARGLCGKHYQRAQKRGAS